MTYKLKLPPPIFVAAGAVYPFSEELLEKGERTSRYGEDYNLFRVVGSGNHRRIWIPRHLAPKGGERQMSDGIKIAFKSVFKARNTEQSRVIEESVDALEAGHNFVLECPTGFGKTACTMDIIAQIGRKTIVVVTKEDIRDQWVNAAKKFLGLKDSEIGFIQGDLFQIAGRKLVIAMVQTLSKDSRHNMAGLSDFGLAIWDECHRVGADFFSQSCFRIPAALRLGLSATPDRKDGREVVIKAHIGPVKVRSEAAPMTPRIITRHSPWRLPMTTVKDKSSGKNIAAPLPHTAGKCGHVINMICNNHARNDLLARFAFAAFKKGRITLIQSDRKEHLETLALLIQSLGVAAHNFGFYVGGISKDERELATGKRIIMATYQMTAEATDIPWLDTLILGTPKSDVRQIVGRVIRQWEGKQEPLVFDVIDFSSPVFTSYWKARKAWYNSIGAKIDVPKTVIKKSATEVN